MKNWLIVFLLLCNATWAEGQFNWDKPARELIDQRICPIDSSADAMIVQKESNIEIVSQTDIYIRSTSKKRIKIYNSNGLGAAAFEIPYSDYEKIKSIEACCYNPDGSVRILAKDQIRDEILVKDKSRDIKIRAKAFAIPGAIAGSIIDLSITSENKSVLFPPVFRFHEDHPVALAQASVTIPDYFLYKYIISNRELLKIEEANDIAINPSRKILTFKSTNIPAIQDEKFRPPTRNLATDIIFILDSYDDHWNKFKFAEDWQNLLDFYPKEINNAMKKSKLAKAIADSLLSLSNERHIFIKWAFQIVRDRWANTDFGYVFGPSDNIDNLMGKKALSPEDKAAILMAILKYGNIDAEINWINSDNAIYKPMPNLPFPPMFDYALTYIPSESLYLDPGDAGGAVGHLDESLMNRLACSPMAKTDFTHSTSSTQNISGFINNAIINVSDSGKVSGSGRVVFYNQIAIESRREFQRLNYKKQKEWLDEILFREYSNGIDSLAVSRDSAQWEGEFTVHYWFDTKGLDIPEEGDFELLLYPGLSIDNILLEKKPPRVYPLYFPTLKYSSVYNIEWQLDKKYKPIGDAKTRIKQGDGSISYSLMSDYDSLANTITVQRQYRISQKILPATYAPQFEEIRKSIKESDQLKIMVQQQ